MTAVVIILAAYALWAAEAAEADARVREQIAEARAAASRGPYAADGVFEGSAEGYGGEVVMQVTIGNGWITEVAILDASHEDEPWLEMVVGLPDRIIEAQTPNVDVVSGATFTSVGMLNGVTEALIKSMEQGGGEVVVTQDADGESPDAAEKQEEAAHEA